MGQQNKNKPHIELVGYEKRNDFIYIAWYRIQYILGVLYDAQINCEVFGILALNWKYH